MTTANFWESNGLDEKIVGLLAEISYHEADHHFGRPFLTAYQLAILFKERFPEEFRNFGHPVGGKDSGVRFSLSSYLAGQLSRKIKNGEFPNIEGGFLSNRRLQGIEFVDGDSTITSSLTESQFDLSMYRYKG